MSLLQQSLVLLRILIPELCGLAVQRRFVVWLAEETLEGQEDRLYVVDSRPLVLEDIKADTAGHINVRVEHWGGKEDGGWLERVVSGEGEGEFEGLAGEVSVIRADDGGSPLEEIAWVVWEG